jgi:DNA-binding GntR family transcriptional regulator
MPPCPEPALGRAPLPATDRPVQRELLGNQIADALRRDILLGVLRPGTKLSQQQLCDQFGTSRMPVRDGLRVLTHEGLLVTDSARHTMVAPLSRDDLLDAYLIEGTLAGIAARRASEKATPEELQGLSHLHDKMSAASTAGEFPLVAELNWKLHRRINQLASSRKLLSAIKALSVDLPRDYLMQMTAWSSKSNTEHAAILEAMGGRKHAAVGSLMTEHIYDAGRGLIEHLESQGLSLD